MKRFSSLFLIFAYGLFCFGTVIGHHIYSAGDSFISLQFQPVGHKTGSIQKVKRACCQIGFNCSPLKDNHIAGSATGHPVKNFFGQQFLPGHFRHTTVLVNRSIQLSQVQPWPFQQAIPKYILHRVFLI